MTITIDRAVTTLNIIRSHSPCADGWQTLLAGLGKTQPDNEPLTLTRIVEINGLNDAIWALRCIEDQQSVRLFAVACAREVQHLMTDPRSLAALDVAERHAHGNATDDELAAAWDAARAAAQAAAWDAADAAQAAAQAAAWDAVEDAAWDAADAARDAARKRQAELFVQFFGGAA